MANFGLRGLPGWPLPPPPLIEGVDRQVHRKARNWTKALESPTSPESPPSVSGEQGHDTHLLPVPHQQKNYSPELTTVIRTSPLRKWSQENLLEQHDESSSDEDQERRQDGDEPPSTSTPQPGSKVSFGLFEEKVKDEEGKGEGEKAEERRGKENASGEENEQASAPVKKTLSLGGEGREDLEGAGVSVRREGEEEKSEQEEGNTTDISISLAEGQEVLRVEVDQRRWRRGLYDYEGDVHSLVGAVVVDDVDVDGE